MTYDLTYRGPAIVALALAMGFAVAILGSNMRANSGQLMLPDFEVKFNIG